jgi:hypothetical protein
VFRFEAFALQVIMDMLPTVKDERVFHDYVRKHIKITNPDDFRRTKHQLYGDLPVE